MRTYTGESVDGFLERTFGLNGKTSPERVITCSTPDLTEIYLLSMSLQTELSKTYCAASEDEIRAKAPSGLPSLVAIISEAQLRGDLDALHVYSAFSVFDNIGVNFAINDLRAALQTETLFGVVTQKHIDTHLRARLIFDDTVSSYSEPEFSAAWSKLSTFIFRHNFHHADRILDIMENRRIIDTDEIEALLRAGESGSPSLVDGVL